jgi:signal transduction histidine kinase
VPDVGRLAGPRVWSSRDLLDRAIQRAWRPSVWLLVAAAVGAAVSAALTGRHADHPGAAAVLQADLIAGLSLAAAFWLRRRPDGRFGRCLIAYAAATAAASLQAADNGVLYAVGVLGSVPLLPVAAYCLLAFPSGRVRGPGRRALLGFVASAAVLVSLPAVLVSPSIESGLPLGACTTTCPANALQVAGVSRGVVDALRWMGGAATALTAVGVAVALVGRVAAGSRPERRTVAAVTGVAGAGALVFAARWVVGEAGGPTELTDRLSWASAVLLALLPAAFVVHLIRAQIAAGSALADMLAGLADRPDIRRWEREVGAALGDPGLRLAFWSAPDQAYVGTDGDPIGDAGRLERHTIDSGGARVAAILHDPGLEADPELLRAAGTATLLALEGQRLAGDTRAARSRILAAAEEERRRLERDLHDGAQQHLIALRVKVGLIGEVDREQAKQVVAELAEEVDATLEELRRLAQGIYPSLLDAEGLVGALHAAARRSSIPVAVHMSAVGRYPAAVESAIYFCCLEALQNAGKHAGPAASATMRVSASDGSLRFRVEDTGSGYDTRTARAGAGFANMAERMAAVDGHVSVVSQPMHGTAVSGWVPIRLQRPLGKGAPR